ncbi:MAG: glycosyltransferase family 2 protein [Acidimicrobiales bacterium]
MLSEPAKGGQIAVIVPAHNEAAGIERTLVSLLAQSLPPARLIVVSDNSADQTPNLVRKYAGSGVEVVRTVNNNSRKAGALNTGIRWLCKGQGSLPAGIQYVFTMDADTELDRHFLEKAARYMDRHPETGAVSAACRGRATPIVTGDGWQRVMKRPFLKWLVMMQHIEYDRVAYTRILSHVHTMSGAGSLIRDKALNSLLTDRDAFDPRPDNLVEDFELTVELKQRGWKVTANERLIAYTDLMPTLGMLLRQRQRWVRGTADELRRRGWTKATWYSKLLMLWGVLAMPVFYMMMAYWVSVMLRIGIAPRSLVVPISVCLVSSWAVRHLGWRYILLEALFFPELAYGIIRYYWFISALFQSRFSTRHSWA